MIKIKCQFFSIKIHSGTRRKFLRSCGSRPPAHHQLINFPTRSAHSPRHSQLSRLGIIYWPTPTHACSSLLLAVRGLACSTGGTGTQTSELQLTAHLPSHPQPKDPSRATPQAPDAQPASANKSPAAADPCPRPAPVLRVSHVTGPVLFIQGSTVPRFAESPLPSWTPSSCPALGSTNLSMLPAQDGGRPPVVGFYH